MLKANATLTDALRVAGDVDEIVDVADVGVEAVADVVVVVAALRIACAEVTD